ncbi:MerR family transcriptional regulator [Ruegeria sediminis]|uniref:MerR family transcriptional regulator n=1 Tax=Ruegeria sediminis TaxID=2583820 RepID=A0ABY2X3N1_9RHOB|nr:MerR family DNA-binding protein [Ruegeria sediminis]TMV09996.1 MerR family transcriptional regulator [Ruegeria sediminis]
MQSLTISQAAREAGMGVETIRFYERKGLIAQPPRPISGGARDYGGNTLWRLKFISGAKKLGFSLAEIADLLVLRTAPNAGCEAFQARARVKRDDIQGRIEGLTRMRSVLDKLIEACPGRGEIRQCSIVDAIEGKETD